MQKNNITTALQQTTWLILASILSGIGCFFLVFMLAAVFGVFLTGKNMISAAFDIMATGHLSLGCSLIFSLAFFFIFKGILYFKRRLRFEDNFLEKITEKHKDDNTDKKG